jgi:hypothetical protein
MFAPPPPTSLVVSVKFLLKSLKVLLPSSINIILDRSEFVILFIVLVVYFESTCEKEANEEEEEIRLTIDNVSIITRKNGTINPSLFIGNYLHDF